MVDPVSLAAGIAGVVSGTVKIGTSLHELRVSYKNAPASFKHLCDEYNIVSELLIAFRDVSEDLVEESAASGDTPQASGDTPQVSGDTPQASKRNFPISPEFVLYTVQAAGATLSDLEKKVNSFVSESNEETVSNDNSGSRIDIRKRLKYIWNESEIKIFVDQLQAHKNSLSLALNIVSSHGNLTIRAALQNHGFALADIVKNQRKMLLTMRKHQFMQTRVASDDQESLFSLDSDYTRFAFDDELLLSKAYQNSPFRDYVNSKFEHDLAKDELIPAGNFWEQSLSIRNLSSIAGKNSIRDSKTTTLDVYDQSEKLHIQSNRPQPTGDQSSNKDLLEITFSQDLKQTLELDRDLHPKSGGQQLNNEQESEAAQRVDSHFQEYRGKYPLMALQRTSRARSQVNHILGVVNIAFQQSQSRKSALGLLKEGGYDVRSRNCKLDEALRWATWNGHEAAVRLLLEKGADIKATTTNGATPLHYAAGNGHEAAVRLLLEKGADITATDKKGATALHLAACNGHEAAVRLLLDKGADITATDTREGATALHLAACNGHEAAVRLLLDKGADITATDTTEGATALYWAAWYGHEAAVRLLLEKGADIKATTTDGGTALHRAAGNGHEAAVRLLLEKGADIKATTKNGWTALHRAAGNGHETAVRLLLEKGADIKATVQDGSTALHFATRGNHKKVMRLLAEKEADIKTEGKDVQRALESNLMPLGRNQPHYAVALCELEATQHGDLSFRKGDVITITKKTENTTDWWTGKIGNKTGIFPSFHISELQEEYEVGCGLQCMCE